MARWRLTAPHYLNVPGEQWMQEETNRDTGRSARKLYDVPTYLHPEDPKFHNYPGEIVVCLEGKGQHRDITFRGEPTPDMEPLDDEAREISKSLQSKWAHPIDTLPSNGDFGTALVQTFERQIQQLMSLNGANKVATAIENDDMETLKAQVKLLAEQNAMLMELAKPLLAKQAEELEDVDVDAPPPPKPAVIPRPAPLRR